MIGPVDAGSAVRAGFAYAIWISLAVTCTAAASAALRSAAGAALLSLGTTGALALTASLLPGWFRYSPGAMPGLAAALAEGRESADWIVAAPFTAAAIAALLAASAAGFRRASLGAADA
ncbi:hypothetical protein ACFQWB_01915 [Paenibacillus thermoaerophilus]|uniref:ABC-2 type transport system permease protein n=1 Tax=Paenibacillus thermoaerophilus TaxID=1215385 RepID=A0ABW2UXT6_9BACL|nr:hypothetical protein [Paenibacillus thermoaerophilus]